MKGIYISKKAGEHFYLSQKFKQFIMCYESITISINTFECFQHRVLVKRLLFPHNVTEIIVRYTVCKKKVNVSKRLIFIVNLLSFVKQLRKEKPGKIKALGFYKETVIRFL